jgi:hypothetical protein
VKLYTIMCAPGYHLSGDGRAFTVKRPNAMGGNRIQRVWLGHGAGAYLQTVITDVPGSTSAVSLVRRP